MSDEEPSTGGLTPNAADSLSPPSRTSMGSNSTIAHETPDRINEKAKMESRSDSRENGTQMEDVPLDQLETLDDESQYPGSVALTLIMVALCLAVFLVALDQTIIATAIPAITNHFGTIEDIGWYGSAYMLTTCSFQLLYGKFYQYFSLKWTFLVAIGIFEIGSLVCGVASSSVVLVVGRAIAGLGCAGIFSGALIILARSTPIRKRPLYTGLLGGVFGIASVAGPLLGGVFTDHVSWRWCFYINLPLGAVTVAIIVFFFKAPKGDSKSTLTWREKLSEFDYPGTLALIPAIISLLLALQWGGHKYAWSSGRIIGLFIVFGILILAFIGIQWWRQEYATIPPRIFCKRTILSAAGAILGIGSAFMLLVFYLPLWFQAVKGTTATMSGVYNLPLILGVSVAATIAGALVTMVGYYTPFLIVGLMIAIVGTGLLSLFEVDSGPGKWVTFQLLAGLGVGLGFQQPLVSAQVVLTGTDIPIGTSIMVFFQTLGGALFVSVGQSVFTNKFAEGLRMIPDLDVEKTLATGATALKSVVPEDQLPAVLVAYNDALVQCFYPALAMLAFGLLCSFGMEWISVKGKKIEAAPA